MAINKESWKYALLVKNPALIIAIFTACVGGLLVSWITGKVQQHSRERELALLAAKDYATAEVETVRRTYDVIGRYLSTIDSLIDTASKRFDYSESQRVALTKDYNSADAEWRSTKNTLGFLLAHYHRGRPRILELWRSMDSAFVPFALCARDWAGTHTHTSDTETGNACKTERATAIAKLNALSDELQRDRLPILEDFIELERVQK